MYHKPDIIHKAKSTRKKETDLCTYLPTKRCYSAQATYANFDQLLESEMNIYTTKRVISYRDILSHCPLAPFSCVDTHTIMVKINLNALALGKKYSRVLKL